MIYNLGHAVFEFIEAKLGQGRAPAVPLLAAQERDRRRRRRLRRSVQMTAGRIRSAVRQVPEGSFQAVPRQGAASRLRTQPGAQSGEDAVPRAPTSIEPSPSGDLLAVFTGNARTASSTSSWSPRTTAAVVRNLTKGFDQDSASSSSSRRRPLGQPVPWFSWSPTRRPARVLRAHREGADADRPERR